VEIQANRVYLVLTGQLVLKVRLVLKARLVIQGKEVNVAWMVLKVPKVSKVKLGRGASEGLMEKPVLKAYKERLVQMAQRVLAEQQAKTE
jgi:hypothetical protein